MRYLAIALTALLAACGAAGAPEKPQGAQTGVSVSGDARIGVTGTL